MARFTLPRDLYHGKGSLENLKNLKGKKAIVCVGGSAMKKFGFLDRAVNYLKEAGTTLPLALTASLTKDQEAVQDFEQAMDAWEKEKEIKGEQKKEAYKELTEEEALKLVASNGTELLYLPDKYRNNEKIVSVAISNDEDAFRYAGMSARDNDRLARQAINADPDNVKYLGQTLRNDPDLYQMAIERDNDLIKDIPVAMQHNATIEKIIAKDNRRQFGLTIKKANEGAELTR